ncbi:MAG: DMT family transporter [Alphaproteobacteria bacterium]|nr:DMT family transporter [Alphaproteobacteria bacterium]
MTNKKRALLIRAIAFMMVGGLSMVLMQASVKLLSDALHPFVITLFRALLVFIIILPILLWNGLSTVKTSSVKLQVIRGGVGGVCMLCMFTGFSLVSLPEATSLLFTVPIFATILSVMFLSERVGIKRWAAIFLGFAGILVITRPDISLNLGHLLLLSAAILWSISIVIAKKLTEKDTIISITFWQAMGCVPLALIASLFVWETPTLIQLLYLLGIAGLGTLGHALVYASLKLGKVSFLLPLDYIRIIWSTLLGFLLFGSLPTLYLYAGTFLIISATAFISYREIQKNKVI